MLRLECPICGLRDETEFVYGGDATIVRPAAGRRRAERMVRLCLPARQSAQGLIESTGIMCWGAGNGSSRSVIR